MVEEFWNILTRTAFAWALLLALVVGVATVLYERRRRWRRSYLDANDGKTLFVLDTRHGWAQFFENNLKKAIPLDVEIVFGKKAENGADHRRAIFDLGRIDFPAITYVSRAGLQSHSLRDELSGLKTKNSKSDTAIQEEASKIILNGIKKIREDNVKRN